MSPAPDMEKSAHAAKKESTEPVQAHNTWADAGLSDTWIHGVTNQSMLMHRHASGELFQLASEKERLTSCLERA